MMTRTRDQDFRQGPLLKKFVMFSLPILAMNMLQLLFNAVDMVIAGRFAGHTALGAVGATGALINLLINLFMGLSVGTSVVVAQDYGAGKYGDVSRSVHTSIRLSTFSSLPVMAIGIFFCEPLLRMMGTPEDILGLSALYMKIYFLGLPAAMVYNFGSAVLRAVGDSRHPMYYLIAAGLLNVGLNIFFVASLGMGVDGLALATVISQYLSVALLLVHLARAEGPIRLNIRALKSDRQKLKQIIRIGLPAGLQGMLFSISNVLIQSAVNGFGTIMVAASSAASNIEGFVGTSMNAFYNAAITFTGQNMGAKKYDRIDTIAKISTGLIVFTWITMGGLTMLFARPLLNIYTDNPQVVELGIVRINILMAAYFTCGMMNVYPGITRGMGYSIPPMLSTLIGACLLRIVWLWTVFAAWPTPAVLFLCYPVTWLISGTGQVGIFLYARKKVRRRDGEAIGAAVGKQ